MGSIETLTLTPIFFQIPFIPSILANKTHSVSRSV